jgi:hypothetical protein
MYALPSFLFPDTFLMKVLMHTVAILLLTLCSFTAFAQGGELLSDLPTTREEFIASEKKVLATIDWLENTPIGTEVQKRKVQSALLLGWDINSPTVTIEFNTDLTMDFSKKNPDLMIVFMGGWTRYALQNGYSQDILQGTLAGLRSAIKVYKTGLLKKDKNMEKIVALEEKGELEATVRARMPKS